jgi:hypothetical protein
MGTDPAVGLLIETSFDFRTDTPPGNDPDAHSPTLRPHSGLARLDPETGVYFDFG